MGQATPPVHLVFGASGQVGWELAQELQARGRVVALSRPQLDLERPETIREAIRTHRPAVIWNAAAATAVDALEDDEALALRVNATAPGVIAEEARRSDALLVHFSTDYVFDGTKPEPYTEDDLPNPLNVYGRSKLAGEEAVRAVGQRHLILRTSWVYSSRGRNFLRTMLALGQGTGVIRVVDDQFGAPTWSRSLARACLTLAGAGRLESTVQSGLFHLTAGGSCSWYQFACAIRTAAIDGGFGWKADIEPIPGTEFVSRARRPANSVLSNLKMHAAFPVKMDHWSTGFHEPLRQSAALASQTRGDAGGST